MNRQTTGQKLVFITYLKSITAHDEMVLYIKYSQLTHTFVEVAFVMVRLL